MLCRHLCVVTNLLALVSFFPIVTLYGFFVPSVRYYIMLMHFYDRKSVGPVYKRSNKPSAKFIKKTRTNSIHDHSNYVKVTNYCNHLYFI